MEAATTTTDKANTTVRKVKLIAKAQPTSDGAGVKLNRAIGNYKIDSLDPFLMLDEFKADDPQDYLAGFPEHPHRGFETVTYMLAGAMEHKDHKGNQGKLTAGSIQWMTAGRGIIHSEMPLQENGLMWGFQLWVNLPAANKMMEPRYQDIAPELVPTTTVNETIKVKILAGEVNGIKGPVSGVVTNPTFLDVTVPANKTFQHTVPGHHSVFAYVFSGSVTVNSTEVPAQNVIAFETGGESVEIATNNNEGRFILVAAAPINEPIARRGPFVMNTAAELQQAYRDYANGLF